MLHIDVSRTARHLRDEADEVRELPRVLAGVQVEDFEARLVVSILRAAGRNAVSYGSMLAAAVSECSDTASITSYRAGGRGGRGSIQNT